MWRWPRASQRSPPPSRSSPASAGAGSPGEPTQVAVAEPVRVREARVVEVGTRRSLVEPVGWEPDPHRVYPMLVSRVPMPATTVAVDPLVDVPVAAMLRDAVQHAGP